MGQAESSQLSIPKPVAPERSWRKFIRVDPAAETIRPLDDSERRALQGDLLRNGQREPVVLRVKGEGLEPNLLDGRHRLDLQEANGKEVVDAEGKLAVPHRTIALPDDADAMSYVLSLNAFRRHLSLKERRELTKKLLATTPEKSDRQIAKEVGLTPTTVGKLRNEGEQRGSVSKMDTTTDSRGRKQARKRKAKGKANAKSAAASTPTKQSVPPKTDEIVSIQDARIRAPNKLCRAWLTASNDERTVFADLYGADIHYYRTQAGTTVAPPLPEGEAA